ncbi:penicillin-sensitive transpeptidase, partial [Vibrio cholerae]
LGHTVPNPAIEDDVSGAEAGAKTAQPAWIEFMGLALNGVPYQEQSIPDNIVRVRIDRDSGLLTNKLDSSSMFEYFIDGTEPKDYVTESTTNSIYTSEDNESLF